MQKNLTHLKTTEFLDITGFRVLIAIYTVIFLVILSLGIVLCQIGSYDLSFPIRVYLQMRVDIQNKEMQTYSFFWFAKFFIFQIARSSITVFLMFRARSV